MNDLHASNGVCYPLEEFWDDLLAYIEERKVIPVIGRELTTVMLGGKQVSIQRAIAERLLAKYGLDGDQSVTLRPYQEMNDAVAAIVRKGWRVQDLYRPINDLLQGIVRESPGPNDALRDLAGITNFDIFITTTFDDLFLDTLDTMRNGGAKSADTIVYAPNLPENERRDIPEIRPSNYHAVFYLFGRASASPVYAIHEEDILEYVYGLLSSHGIGPERMIAEVRNRNLLIIGCHFPDWLSRFFIRLSNQMRLSSGERIQKEFLVGHDVSRTENLTVFLENFSHNTRLYPCDGLSFVKELATRWNERHPMGLSGEAQARSSQTGDIFISYSRADMAAAKTLYGELEQLGSGVIWFDKAQIKPGYDWSAKIMSAIKRCRWFLPIISSTTESRDEGFFRKEWSVAVERDEMIQGRRFIIPVVVDGDYEGNANRYRLIPDRFRKFHFGHAPKGHMDTELEVSIKNALRDLRRGRSS